MEVGIVVTETRLAIGCLDDKPVASRVIDDLHIVGERLAHPDRAVIGEVIIVDHARFIESIGKPVLVTQPCWTSLSWILISFKSYAHA